ncbi:MAG: hypothetical protein OXC57_11700 [Rhodobacteraceae bacterium]|nr:hypothetical protein [Paracoccaceae bacterium]
MHVEDMSSSGWIGSNNSFRHMTDWLRRLIQEPANPHSHKLNEINVRNIVQNIKPIPDICDVDQELESSSISTMWNASNLELRLANAFEEIPLEEGFFHPAEQILDEAINSSHKEEVLDWLLQTITNKKDSFFSLSVLRSLAHLRPATPERRVEIISIALSSKDIETRDVAAQLAESWDDMEVKDILKKHTEPIPWLQSYINEVIDNLGK